MKKSYQRALPADWRRVAGVYSALGDEHRQRILLMFEPGEVLNVGQIVAASTLSRTAVSHHLRVLREAGVLVAEKRGKEVYYRIDKPFLIEAMERVVEYIRSSV